MSGGYFNYADNSARYEIFGYGDKPINVFDDMEITDLIWDVFGLIRDYDYYMSGDTSKEKYIEAKAGFKKKWFQGDRDERIRGYIDDAIAALKTELYENFDFEEEP